MSPRAPKRRVLPFFVEFVKFCTGFAVIITVALLTLRLVSTGVEQIAL